MITIFRAALHHYEKSNRIHLQTHDQCDTSSGSFIDVLHGTHVPVKEAVSFTHDLGFVSSLIDDLNQ